MWYHAAWHCLSVNVLLSNITFLYMLLRIVFRENYGYSNEYQSVDIRVLLDQMYSASTIIMF